MSESSPPLVNHPENRAPRESAARAFYLAYLNSSSWRITRNRALRLADFKCSQCGSKRELEVHHTCYDRLGREWDQDLQVLCRSCHLAHHDVDRAQEGQSDRIYLKVVGSVMHGADVVTFADLAEAVKVKCAQLKIPYDSARIGSAISLIAWKQKTKQPAATFAALIVSPEPVNKAEALRFLSELSERQERPLGIHTMPTAMWNDPDDVYRAEVRRRALDEERY